MARIVLVVHPEDRALVEALVAASPCCARVGAVVPGGAERTDSVRHGVEALDPSLELVAVHDAARPLVTSELVDRVLDAAARDGAALAAVPVADTIKESRDGRRAERTLARERLWAAQTPQAFRRARFAALLAEARAGAWTATDDAALWERAVGPVTIVRGEACNQKVTDPTDLALAEALLARRDAPGRTP